MINFRFHLVSLIAVFLAMGLGILVGSTVVDQVIVDRLDREISSVSHESNQIKSDNRDLKDQISRLNDYLKKSSAYAVQQRLTASSVVIIAEKGVGTSAVSSVLASLRAAGASVPGVLWLDDKWKLDQASEVRALQKAARVTGKTETTRLRALRALATRLTVPTAPGARRPRDIVEPLRSAGFLDFTDGKKSELAQFPERPSRVLVLTGTDSDLAGTTTLVDFVGALVAAKAPTVVGEVYDANGTGTSAPSRGAALQPVRGNPSLAKLVTTLDDADLPQGDLTAVIALEQIADGIVGHYGYGKGATVAIPPIPS